MKVLVLGDTHANWPATKSILNRKLRENPDIRHIIQVGDFGFWPNVSQWHLSLGKMLEERNVFLHFADGNHEDHQALAELRLQQGDLQQVYLDPDTKRIWHWKRGSMWLAEEDIKIMFFGGAASVDRQRRTPGVSWFSEELPSWEDFEFALETIDSMGAPDFVVAHDTPDFAPPQYDSHQASEWPAVDIQSSKHVRMGLARLHDVAAPAVWFAGHHHIRLSGFVHGTMFEVMANDGHPYDAWSGVFDLGTLRRRK